MYGGGLFPHLRYQDKFMDDSSKGNDRLNASKVEVREILRTLDQTSLENASPIWDDGKMILEEGHIALKTR